MTGFDLPGRPALSAFAFLLAGACSAPGENAEAPAESARLDVRIIADEADAALAILDKRAAGEAVGEEDWALLFASEGYIRLKRREDAMRRTFTDDEFKAFMESEELLARRAALSETLSRWKQADPAAAGRLALAYLPDEARIGAKIYPMIKPRENSFVFEIDTDPAIFLFLDPARTKAQFENTLAHELHHIGYGTACPTAETAAAIEAAPETVRDMIGWMGAFGEGFAMLAAAGGPDVHPHAESDAETRARWDGDVARFDENRAAVETFFLGLLDGSLSEDQATQQGFSFFGVQGPWYTVGWTMAVEIERAFGRARLIESFCDPRLLPPAFNEAIRRNGADERLSAWAPSIIEALETADKAAATP